MKTNENSHDISATNSDTPSANKSSPLLRDFGDLLKELGIDSGSYLAAAECENVGEIIRKRSGVHGDAFENLQDIADRWSRYLTRMCGMAVPLTVGDVAYLMVEMKLSRATYGDDSEVDHPRDIMGYSGIWAAYLEARKAATNRKK